MNKLELEMLEALRYLSTDEQRARMAAKIALRIAEKAYNEGKLDAGMLGQGLGSFEDFKKEIL